MTDLWLHPLIIASISAFLAVLITVIDGLVNNYGDVEIDINSGSKKLVVKGGAPLLGSLAERKIFVPSACGGRGTCGACKVKILSDVGPVLPTETPFLNPTELKNNTRLSCQVKVKSKIRIEIPESLFNVQSFQTRVSSIRNVTYDIREVRFELLNPNDIRFKPGQYMQLEIPPYGKIRTPTQRAYSISSLPKDNHFIELLIRLVKGGIATTYVFDHLKVGDELRLIGPFGDFHVQETMADMVCVAGGSGMAPFNSILFDMFERGDTGRRVWYFFGARTQKDLFYVEKFRSLEKQWPQFRFIPALSEPQPGESWDGESGLITVVLDKYMKGEMDPHSVKEGYLCGSPGMIDACVKVMNANAIPTDRIFYDKFA
jgi:Na+-transporting NADH:ubiquinone oxidoreductase subunit F